MKIVFQFLFFMLLMISATNADGPTRTRLPNGLVIQTRPLGNSTIATVRDTNGRTMTAVTRALSSSTKITNYRDDRGRVQTVITRKK